MMLLSFRTEHLFDFVERVCVCVRQAAVTTPAHHPSPKPSSQTPPTGGGADGGPQNPSPLHPRPNHIPGQPLPKRHVPRGGEPEADLLVRRRLFRLRGPLKLRPALVDLVLLGLAFWFCFVVVGRGWVGG